jgi:UDP-3-O-[3-hydroxymyristoyl] glucosamine N-acyltransferase
MKDQDIWARDIAAFLGLPLYGDNIKIERVSTLTNATSNSLVFVKKNQHPELKNITAQKDIFAILPSGCLSEDFECPRIFSENPRLSFARAVKRFFTEALVPVISPLALVSPNASIGESVSIGPYSIIEDHVIIGENTEIRNNVLIKRGSQIGRNCIIRAFTVIGEEGFGFERDENQRPIRIPHIGNAILRDDIEIGNFCTVCRGTIDDTVIMDGVKIDDHCHVAHNVQVGENTIITAGSVLSGSSSLGNAVWLGPNSTILNGIPVLNNATVGIGAVVIRKVNEGDHVLGNPATRSR